jgi:hypothetical protein
MVLRVSLKSSCGLESVDSGCEHLVVAKFLRKRNGQISVRTFKGKIVRQLAGYIFVLKDYVPFSL